jgi:RecA-family ATPase
MEHGKKDFDDAVAWLQAKLGGDAQQEQSKAKASWRAAIPIIDISNWDNEPIPQQEWAVPNRVPIRKVTIFSGEGAAGKSLLQLQLSVAHAIGGDWLGTTPVPGPAIFIDAEDDADVMHKRLGDILQYHARKFADVKNNLHLVSLAGKDAVLGVLDRKTNRIVATDFYGQLLEMAADLKPKMIGIASSADVFAGNEIDRSQVQQFVGLMTRVAIAANGSVVLISHPSLTGISSDTGLSGSTQWHNSVRARFYLKSVKPSGDDAPDTNLRVIEFKKNNYGPVSESIPLSYRDGLFLPIAGTTSVDEAARDQRADETFLAVLTILHGQRQDLGISRFAPNYAPTRIAQHQRAQGLRKHELEAAMQRLLDHGKIHIEIVGPPSKQRKYSVAGEGCM